MSSAKACVSLCIAIVLSACGDINIPIRNQDAGPRDATTEPTSCSADADCTSRFACRVGTCNQGTGTCDYAIGATWCFVDGECYQAGQERLGDRCTTCDPDRSQDALIKKVCPAGQVCGQESGECVVVPPDVGPDVEPDVGTDLGQDIAVPPDVGPDVAPDVGPDIPTCGDGGPTVGPDMPELCDGKDNDCDGDTDEGFEYNGKVIGAACDGVGACGIGTIECDGSGTAATCSTNPDGSSSHAGNEICNDLDDDCDGLVNEDWTEFGQPCDGDDSDGCKKGTWTCTAAGDAVECTNESETNIPELCNDLDDDCDDLADEDWPELGQPCDGDDSDECENGTWTCTAAGDAVECTNESETDIPELCNDLDDDCDGVTDEECPCGSLGVVCPSSFTCTSNGTCENLTANEAYVPGGTFWMGCNAAVDTDCIYNEYDQHEVDVPTFVIDRTEVTAAEYKTCVLGGGCTLPSTTVGSVATYDVADKQQHPINYVDWDQSVAFCSWRAGQQPGKAWRLCTESEWEKAARGGCALYAGDCAAAMPKYPWGNEEPSCESPALAVFKPDGGTNSCGAGQTWAVGSKPDGASPYGALDMAGNVWEWVEDPYHTNYDGAPADGTAWLDPPSSLRIDRGGGHTDLAAELRASRRAMPPPSHFSHNLGFRCCRSFP